MQFICPRRCNARMIFKILALITIVFVLSRAFFYTARYGVSPQRIKFHSTIKSNFTSDGCRSPVPLGTEMDQPWPWTVNKSQLLRLRECMEMAAMCDPSISEYYTVIMVLVDKGFEEMLDSYIFYLKERKITKNLFISLDKDTHNSLVKRGMNSFLSLDLGEIGTKHSSLNSPSWHQKGHYKFKMATMILNLNFAVLVNDLDITYLSDPFIGLSNQTYDVALQSDFNVKDSSFNAGFVYFRPTDRSKCFLREFSGFLEKNHNVWDQAVLNDRLRISAYNHEISYQALPFNEYVPGLVFKEDEYMYFDPSEELLNKMSILHHIHLDYQGKIFRMKELGLWKLDRNGYYSDENAKYMTYQNPLPSLQHAEYDALENAFKIAKILRRTLILPKFHCKKKRESPAQFFSTAHIRGSPYCSLYHLLQDKHDSYNNQHLISDYMKKHPEGFRESSFLRHPLVPLSVKTSKVSDILILTNVVLENGFLMNNVKEFLIPRNRTKGPSKKELVDWLDKYNDVSVIEFKHLYSHLDFCTNISNNQHSTHKNVYIIIIYTLIAQVRIKEF